MTFTRFHHPIQQSQPNAPSPGWSVGQHLEHLALVNFHLNQRIVSALEVPAQNADQRPNWRAHVMLWTGYIPAREGAGAGCDRAPGPFAGHAACEAQRDRDALQAFESRLAEIESSRGRSPHPILGMFYSQAMGAFHRRSQPSSSQNHSSDSELSESQRRRTMTNVNHMSNCSYGRMELIVNLP